MRSLLLSLVIVVVSVTAFGQGAEKFFIVKVTDHAKKTTYELKSAEELKALEKECKLETKLWPKALVMAEKAWKANEANKEAFPKSCGAPKSFSATGKPYTDKAEAEEKLYKFLNKIAEKDEEEAKMLEKMTKNKNPGMEKRLVKEKDKEKVEFEARALIESQLAQLMESAPAPAPAPAAK